MKKLLITLGSFLFAFVILHLALEPIAKYYVNKSLSNMKGYTGSVHDIDIALWRGAYRIDSLEIINTSAEYPEPFVSVSTIDISVDWKALLNWAIKAEIILEQPKLNFITSKTKETQDGHGNDWLQTINNLVPIQINTFEIKNGTKAYRDFNAYPQVDIVASEINAKALNLSTVQNDSADLPTHIRFTSKTTGNGSLSVMMDLNMLKETPDFDLNMALRGMDLTYLQDFTKAYAGFTFQNGRMNVFSEVSMKDNNYVGYIKPLLVDVKVLNGKEKASIFQKAWEVIVGTVFELFENQRKDQFATKIPIEGNLAGSEVNVYVSIINVLKNAFVQAFDNQIDQTIHFEIVDSPGES